MVLMQQSKALVFREVAVIAMQDHAGLTNRAFLHGLSTHTRMVSLWSYSRRLCAMCVANIFVDRTKLHNFFLYERVDSVASIAWACWFLMWRRMSSLEWWYVAPYIQQESIYLISTHMFRGSLAVHGGTRDGKLTSC